MGSLTVGGSYSCDPADVLRFQHKRIVTALYVAMLQTLEDLALEHDSAMAKLEEKLPDQYKPYVDLADYLDEAKSQQMRKRVLDRGNNALRELEEVVKGFHITLR